jgi:hypothetical protein
MSIAVVGGVIVSTFLTLFVVPCFYSIAEDWREVLARVWRRIFPAPVEAGATPGVETQEDIVVSSK